MQLSSTLTWTALTGMPCSRTRYDLGVHELSRQLRMTLRKPWFWRRALRLARRRKCRVLSGRPQADSSAWEAGCNRTAWLGQLVSRAQAWRHEPAKAKLSGFQCPSCFELDPDKLAIRKLFKPDVYMQRPSSCAQKRVIAPHHRSHPQKSLPDWESSMFS